MTSFKTLASLDLSLTALALAGCIISKPVGENPTEGATEGATAGETDGATTDVDTDGATSKPATSEPDTSTGPLETTGPGETTGPLETTDPLETTGTPQACPANPNYFCSEPFECPDDGEFCGGLFSAFDSAGCLRQSCSDDRDCGLTERCFTAEDWGGCVSSSFECEELSGECGCSSSDDCGGSYCVPKDISPPAFCPAIKDQPGCIQAGCGAFETGPTLLLEGDTCSCGEGEPACVWFDGPGAGGDPEAYYRWDTGEVRLFGATYVEPPIGWNRCVDGAGPPACTCFVPGEDPCV